MVCFLELEPPILISEKNSLSSGEMFQVGSIQYIDNGTSLTMTCKLPKKTCRSLEIKFYGNDKVISVGTATTEFTITMQKRGNYHCEIFCYSKSRISRTIRIEGKKECFMLTK